MPKVRKVIRTTSGAVMVTVADIVPEDWDYVEVEEITDEVRKKTRLLPDSKVIKITVISKVENTEPISPRPK